MKFRSFKGIIDVSDRRILNLCISFLSSPDSPLRVKLIEYITNTSLYQTKMSLINKAEILAVLSLDRIPLSYLTGEHNNISLLNWALREEFNTYISNTKIYEYIKWGIISDFIDYDIMTDTVSLTDSGILLNELFLSVERNKKIANVSYDLLLQASNNKEEQFYREAIFKNKHTLGLLYEIYKSEEPLTYFELAFRLFKNNDEDLLSTPFKYWLEKIKYKSKKEKDELSYELESFGDSYTRTMCDWLINVGFITTKKRAYELEDYNGRKYAYFTLEGYSITEAGMKYLMSEQHYPAEKKYYLNYEISSETENALSNDEVYNLVFEYLSKKKGKATLTAIKEYLDTQSVNYTEKRLKSFLQFLEAYEVIEVSYSTRFKSKNYSIQELIKTFTQNNVELSKVVKQKLIDFGIKENHALIDFSFNPDKSLEFEELTHQLLVSKGRISSDHITSTPAPDVVAYDKDYGLIIDNKSSQRKVSITKTYQRQMKEYIEDALHRDDELKGNWWTLFDENIRNYQFLFVAGLYNTKNLENHLSQIEKRIKLSTIDTNKLNPVRGAAITADNLLVFLNLVENGGLHIRNLFKHIDEGKKILEYY